jgi:WD40 repeat protein/class 3 adenylate cyclase
MTVRTRPAGQSQAAVRTFLIADIRGYTRFTAEQGDEAASRLAAKFAEIATEGVEAWGGNLIELRGDEALAVFASARSALRAAVELQAAFAAETALEPDLPLGVGIGLDAGEAVAVGEGYRGAALNLAARLCSMAAAGQIVASQNLAHLAGPVSGVDYEKLGATALKGFAEPVPAVRVAGAAAEPARPAAPVEAGPPPPLPATLEAIVPLAGRETDLRWLAWHWRRAGHGAGRVIVLSGPPGMGKTRLASELAARAHGEGATVVYLPAAAGVGELDDSAANTPRLVIVDDLDAAQPADRKLVAATAGQVQGRPMLLLVTHRVEAAATVVKLVEGLSQPEQRRALSPLEPDEVRAIAALYAGRTVDRLPLARLLDESAGVPAAIHRLAAAWSRSAASERLAATARETSAGRRGLLAAQDELISSVTDLELARERAELYGADRSVGQPAVDGVRLEVCPYKGLAAFEAGDADYYFGRERLVAELVARLVGAGFLGVIGASGSGKSSALRAGLLPALAGGVLPGADGWVQVLLRPGESPMDELGRALGRALPEEALAVNDPAAGMATALAGLAEGQRLVIVVDQFEEVFNATRDEAERQAFIDLLTSQNPRLKVVVAMRADHYGHCAAYPALARLIGANQVLVGALTRIELAAVIEHPAQRVGLRVEPELTKALLDDVGDEPGTLPLLSTALLELWQARDRGRLTLAAYHASGGVRGAVARLAEAAYGSLDDGQQLIARSLFLRLAGPGEGEGVVRRQVPLAELDIERDAAVAEVLAALTDARLLTAGDTYVEVAHEALLREWPRLQEWLDEDAAGRTLRLHLIGAALEWERRGREPGDLYRGARLAAALDWAPAHEVELNTLEREFVAESRAASEREAQRQRQVNRRLRVLLAGGTVLLVVAVAAGALAFVERGRADLETQVANARALAARAAAALEDDPELSLLLALASVEEMKAAGEPVLPEAIEALHAGVLAHRIVLRVPNNANLVAWSPDGMRLAISSEEDPPVGDAFVRIIDPGGGEGIAEFRRQAGDGPLLGAALEASGERLVTTHRGEVTAIVWDAANGARLPIALQGHGGVMFDPAFTSDGSGLAVSNDDGTVSLWSLASGTEVYRIDVAVGSRATRDPTGYGSGIDFSPDGLLMVTTEPDLPGAVLRRVEDGSKLWELRTGSSIAAAFSPDGTRVAVLESLPGTVRVFEIATGESVGQFAVGGVQSSIEWSPDGSAIAVAGYDAVIYLISAADGRLLSTLRGHVERVSALAFSRDGRRLASAGRGRTTLLWDLIPAGRGEVASHLADLGPVMQVHPSSDGARIYTSSFNGVVHVLDARNGDVLQAIPSQLVDWPIGIALSPDGNLLAVTTRDQVTSILDAGTMREKYTLPGGFYVKSFSPDGAWVLVDGAGQGRDYTGPPRVLDVASGREVFQLSGSERIQNAAWSPDGTLLATAPASGQLDWLVRVYDTQSRSRLAELMFDAHATAVAFRNDGSQLAVSGNGVNIVDVASLREGRTELVATLPNRSGSTNIQAIYFSPDDAQLIGSSLNEELAVWDASSWELSYTIRSRYANPSMALMASGREIVSGGLGYPGLVVFTLDVDELVAIAHDRLTRTFTTAECVRYLRLDECPAGT